MLTELAADPEGPATVMVTHHVEEIPPGCSHAMLLREGRVVAQGLLDDVMTSENLSATFGQPLELASRRGRFTAIRQIGSRPDRCARDRGGSSVTEFVRLEVEGGVGTIRLDRPPMNAVNRQLNLELAEISAEAAGRTDVRAVVVYGGEKVLAAGADVKEMAALTYSEMAERDPRAVERASARSRRSPSRRSPRSPATPSAAASSSRSRATAASPATTPRSASPRSCSGSSPAAAGRSGSRG